MRLLLHSVQEWILTQGISVEQRAQGNIQTNEVNTNTTDREQWNQ